MKYINKEYGFTFRPPFFDKFHEEKSEGKPISEENFPKKFIQGAGYDYSAVNGAMLVGKKGSIWGIKVSYFNGKKWLDGEDFAQNMGLGCANTTDGSFAHFASGPLSVKWVKKTDESLVLAISSRKKLKVRVIFYPAYGFHGELSLEDNTVKGRSPHVAILPGEVSLADNNAVFRERYQVVYEGEDEKEYFLSHSYFNPLDSANGAFNEGIMDFIINENQPSVYFYATVGNEEIFESEVPRLDKIKQLIDESELKYGVNKTHGNGILGASTERMLNSVMWSRIYYPYLMKEIFSPHRTNLNKHFDLKGVDENCSAILGTYAEIDKVKEQLLYTVEDKILAPLSLWHAFCHAEDKLELMKLYKSLSKLYPPDSSFITTTDETRAEVAYKWNDSPLKEIRRNGNGLFGVDSPMYSLDLTCLKLLAFDIIERILAYYDASERAKYKKAKKELIETINKIFYNEEEGLYMNRYISGDWVKSENVGATSFYPLISGAVNCPKKLAALINNLTNPKTFWTNSVLPTLSAAHPEFGKKGKPNNNAKRNPPYFEYRGSIIPYVNYLVYQGLVRYGLDEVAGEFALKCARLWSNNVTHNVENYSMYLPTGKRYKKSTEHLSSNGNMLALIGMQEIIDIEYFRDDMKLSSIRFGSLVQGTNSITNLKLLGKTYSIDINDEQTILIIDDETIIKGSGGKFKVRNFTLNQNGCEFLVSAKQNIKFNINIFNKNENTKYYFLVPTGLSKVVAQNGMVKIEEIATTE